MQGFHLAMRSVKMIGTTHDEEHMKQRGNLRHGTPKHEIQKSKGQRITEHKPAAHIYIGGQQEESGEREKHTHTQI
jgi:hypothetical protein